MSDLVLNSFPAEVTPNLLRLPYVNCENWKRSSQLRRLEYKKHRTYRYELDRTSERVVRIVLVSGPDTMEPMADFDLADIPSLGPSLIDHSLSLYLSSLGLETKQTKFERLALRRIDTHGGLVQLYSGISFRTRRPFAEHPYTFITSAQWVARATFVERLSNEILCKVSPGLGVLYVPTGRPVGELQRYTEHYLGRVKEVDSSHALISCKDNMLRRIPLNHLMLEASPEAIRRYEENTASNYQQSSVFRKLQQLSQVLTPKGRRNTSVLRDRLEAIRKLLGGISKEQIILPLDCYQAGTVSIGLAPLRLELSA